LDNQIRRKSLNQESKKSNRSSKSI